MKRRIVIALLALGTIGGFTSGVVSVVHHRHHRDAWERHVAKICTDAARAETPAR